MTATRGGALNNQQIMRAAGVVLLGFLASGILGLVRTAVFSAQFGTSVELDVFYTAQRIPELLYNLVAGGALGSSFIPVFTRLLNRDVSEDAWKLASAVMTLSSLAALILGIMLILVAPLYIPLLAGDLPPRLQTLTANLTQIMLVTTFIFSISGLSMGILQTYGNFTLPALALSMHNIGLIVGAVLIAPAMALTTGIFAYDPISSMEAARLLPDGIAIVDYMLPPNANIYGLAIGAVLGASLHLLIQLPGLFALRAPLRVLPDLRIEGVGEVLRLMLPRVIGLGVAQINFLVNIFFAIGMVEGSLTALNTAWFLMFFSLGVIGQSVGTAVFPTLSSLAGAGDMAGYRARLASAMRSVLFLAFPATVGFIVLGEPVIALLFERGEWTADSTTATAWALSFFALGISGHALLEVLSRAFYALSDTWTPVLVGVGALLTNIVLSIVFIRIIGNPDTLVQGPFAGLALANSLTTLVESGVLWWLMRRRVGGIQDAAVFSSAGRALVAAVGMGAVVWVAAELLHDTGTLMIAIGGTVIGGVVFFGLAFLLRMDEARTIPALLLKRGRR